jgi:hypothetical protein
MVHAFSRQLDITSAEANMKITEFTGEHLNLADQLTAE